MTPTQPTAEQLELARECAAKAADGYLALPLPDDHPLVQSAILAIQATEARMAAAVEVLDEIAAQKLRVETFDYNPDDADWEGGFEECVKRARQAIAMIRSQSNG